MNTDSLRCRLLVIVVSLRRAAGERLCAFDGATLASAKGLRIITYAYPAITWGDRKKRLSGRSSYQTKNKKIAAFGSSYRMYVIPCRSCRRLRSFDLALLVAVAPHPASNLECLASRADIRLALPRDIERGAVGRCGDGNGQATLNRDATGEAHQLERDLPLVVIHRHDRVKGAGVALDLEENRVARVRSFRRDSKRLGLAHRWADDVQFFTAERAVVAVVRVQTADADARFFQAVALEGGVDQLNRFHHPLLAEQPRHFSQRDVRGHPRSPEIVEHVELAEWPVEIQQLGEPVQLIVVGHAGHVQRGLVQRPEQYCVGGPGFGQAQRFFQRVEAVATANDAGLAARKFTEGV